MTRQHFQALADEIKWIDDPVQRRIAAEAVARVCRKFNSGFKLERFLTACGVQ